MNLYSLFDLFGAPNPDSLENRNLSALRLLTPPVGKLLKKYFRAEVRGIGNIPPGAALYVGNHNMAMLSLDTAIFCAEALRAHGTDALPFGLAHDMAVSVPVVRDLILAVGGVRASHENAHAIFAAGKKAMVYPGGGLEAMRSFANRNRIVFGGRTGYMRLALRENVPIVPVVAAGAHSASIILTDGSSFARTFRLDKLLRADVWPLMLCLPWGLWFGPTPFYIPYPTKILISVMEPMTFPRTGPEAEEDEAYVRECADRVENAMQLRLTELARERSGRRRGK
ncbi:MAG: lysophospholipid acyltransferase family protein [Thermodesulfobacteriota bacterium]